ncbi:MAG: ParB N-terminal domain-containing protein, partial [Synergistales bacterium]|nr:ParB N-terminal domain-containing protein [Synergistales bacterium]
MSASLQQLPLELLDDHPDNPRLVFREDVIDAIAANLNGHYPQKHAIHVRPAGERFQVLSGHHRVRAARKAGLEEIWAWVEPMDDESALMELVLSNSQGELSPLEIG